MKVKGGSSPLTQPAREKVKVNSERAEDMKMKVDCELPEQAAGDSKQAGLDDRGFKTKILLRLVKKN